MNIREYFLSLRAIITVFRTQVNVKKGYDLDGSLILSKRTPSRYGYLCASDETFKILPSIMVSREVFSMFSKRRFVKRK